MSWIPGKLSRAALPIILAMPLIAAHCDETRCVASGFSPNETVVIQQSPSDSTTGVADSSGNVDAPCGSTVTNLGGGTTATATSTPSP